MNKTTDYEKFVEFLGQYFLLKKIGNAVNKKEFSLKVKLNETSSVYFDFDNETGAFLSCDVGTTEFNWN